MRAIFKKELQSYFITMSGYIVIAIYLAVTGLFFTQINIYSSYSDYSATIAQSSILYLIMIPLITMRLFPEEVKLKTDQLLFTSPLPLWKIVLGKYFAAFALLLLSIAATMLYPLIMTSFGEVALDKAACAFLGFILFGGALTAVGLLISAFTDNQIIAGVITFVAVFLVFIIDSLIPSLPSGHFSSVMFLGVALLIFSAFIYVCTYNPAAAALILVLGLLCTGILYATNPLLFDGLIGKVFRWLSLPVRYYNFSKGVLNLSDIVYYLTFIAGVLVTAVSFTERKRYS